MSLQNTKKIIPPIIDVNKQGSIACHFNNITAKGNPEYSIIKTIKILKFKIQEAKTML